MTQRLSAYTSFPPNHVVHDCMDSAHTASHSLGRQKQKSDQLLSAKLRKFGSFCSYPVSSTTLTVNIHIVVGSPSLNTQSNSKEKKQQKPRSIIVTDLCLLNSIYSVGDPKHRGTQQFSRMGLQSELNNHRRKKPKVWLSELSGFYLTFSIPSFASAASIFTNV